MSDSPISSGGIPDLGGDTERVLLRAGLEMVIGLVQIVIHQQGPQVRLHQHDIAVADVVHRHRRAVAVCCLVIGHASQCMEKRRKSSGRCTRTCKSPPEIIFFNDCQCRKIF